MIRRIGVMGGTFNPIHFGHLVAAEEARRAFRLEKVIFIPSGDPPHKSRKDLWPAGLRYLLTLLAIAENPVFEASRIEIDRKGPTYTTDTLKSLHRQFPQTDIYFITGIDAILEMHTWNHGANLLRQALFVAASRPGHRLDELPLYFTPTQLKRILPLEIPLLAISSTDIRRRLKAGLSIRYLIPAPVADYLISHRVNLAGAA
ncbi:MAG: nicotinate-nucleotide adenylyltransferase [bacterium]